MGLSSLQLPQSEARFLCLLFLSHYLGLPPLPSLFLEIIHVLDALYSVNSTGFSSDPGRPWRLDGSQQWFLWAWLHRHETGTPNLVGPSKDRFADYDCSLPATSTFMLKPCVFSWLPCLSSVDDYSGLLRTPGRRLQSRPDR